MCKLASCKVNLALAGTPQACKIDLRRKIGDFQKEEETSGKEETVPKDVDMIVSDSLVGR